MSDVREGLLAGGLPYRAAGAGSVVVVFGGIEADNADPANPTAGSLAGEPSAPGNTGAAGSLLARAMATGQAAWVANCTGCRDYALTVTGRRRAFCSAHARRSQR